MDVSVLLESVRAQVLDEAYAALGSAHVAHYETAGEPLTRQRLADLHDLVVTAIRDRDLTEVTAYSERVAEERFSAGFDISEVQTAFNALEAAMWRHLVAEEPPADLAEAVGLLSTVLGAGKDALARTYVSLAGRRHVPSLDLTALFTGAGS
ncbi:MAG TPA: hypothetical protein VLV82_02705 [Candidatus Angelobacter sp.]|nr:hypothetical protein [Candidatus Angelobacter sp.]